jgi:hypothetical protein
VGTSLHLSGEMFKVMTRADMRTSHTRVAGRRSRTSSAASCEMTFGNMPTVLPHARAGGVRAIAGVAAGVSARRFRRSPGAGFPGDVVAGVAFPPARRRIDKLADAIRQAMTSAG